MTDDPLLTEVYERLRNIAGGQIRRERDDHTLQATALVNEAWMQLARDGVTDADEDRTTFYNFAAEAMRRVLIDHARKRGRQKRGGGWLREPLTALDLAAPPALDEVMAFDEALAALAREEPRSAEVVRLRFYAGLEVGQTAEVLGISPRTAAREWAYARAWLYRAMGVSDPEKES